MQTDTKTRAPDDEQAGARLFAYLDDAIDNARKANAEPIQVIMSDDDYRLFMRYASERATFTTTHREAYRGYPIHIGSITRVRSKRDYSERERLVKGILHRVAPALTVGDRLARELPPGAECVKQWEHLTRELRIALGEFWQQEAGR